jgi:hypothetical protein
LLSHFLRAWGFKDVIQRPPGVRGRGRPHRRLSAEEAPRNARGCSLLERKSTGKFNTAFEKKELQGAFNNKIKFGFVDPTLAEGVFRNMLMTIILVQFFNMNTEYYTNVKYGFYKKYKK